MLLNIVCSKILFMSVLFANLTVHELEKRFIFYIVTTKNAFE